MTGTNVKEQMLKKKAICLGTYEQGEEIKESVF
jgi:hypothetical protein